MPSSPPAGQPQEVPGRFPAQTRCPGAQCPGCPGSAALLSSGPAGRRSERGWVPMEEAIAWLPASWSSRGSGMGESRGVVPGGCR